MAYWEEYTWIVVLGAIAAFAMGWGIGANDVANCFGSSVGSKALTIKQAILIAAIFEFAGALALGGNTARTIAGSIASTTLFTREPEILMYGMLCALASAAIWLYVATYNELAVSTTHSIVGAVMGFALVYGGPNGVIWFRRRPDFPFVSGFTPIVMSWFIAPIMSGIIAAFVFFLTRTFVMRSKNAYQRAFWGLPILVLITLFINMFFVLYKGAGKELKWDANKVAWVSAVIAVGCAAFTAFVILPILRKKVARELEAMEKGLDVEGNPKDADGQIVSAADAEPQGVWGKVKKQLLRGVEEDVFKTVKEDEPIMKIHEHAEKFDPHAEEVFKYLQVFTAACDTFAHGANDVANSIGPFAAIWTVYTTQKVSSNSGFPIWVLVLGGGGMVVGLATYGYHIIKALGVQLVSITPSRGYCIELGTAITISIGSRYGIPLSTTQCQVGATMGVGFLEGARGVNWKLFAKTFLGWIFTIFVAMGMSAAIFAQGVYAPSILQGKQIIVYENYMNSSMVSMLRTMNDSVRAWNNTPNFDRDLFSQINRTSNSLNSLRRNAVIPAKNYTALQNTTIRLYMNNSISTIGQNKTAISAVLVKPPPK